MLKKVFVQKKLFRNNLTVPKTVEQCRKYPIPYLNTLKRTIPYLNTLSRTIPYLNTLNRTMPYLNTLNPIFPSANSSPQPIKIEHYVTRELSARYSLS